MPEKEKWEEEAERFAEEEYETFERKYKGEDWWEELKRKWGKEKIKELLFEYARRCLLHKPDPKDYEAYDYVKALEASVDYAGPSEELYKYLVGLGVFPPPPKEEAATEALKEEAKARHEELQWLFDFIEKKGYVEAVKKRYARTDYKRLYDETRKKLKKLEEEYEKRKKELEEVLRKYREAVAERDRMIDEIAKRIWREWAKKPVKPKLDYFQLIEIIRIFVDECRRRNIDPNAVKVEEILSPYLTFEENKKNVLKKLEEYKALPPEEAEKLRRELEEWKRKAEEAEKRYLEEKKREEEALKPPKPILGDREYGILLKEFLDQVEDRVILSRELREALQRIFKLEWEANKIAYMDFRSAENFVRDLAEKWAKTVEAELREYKGLIPKVKAETEKKIALDYEKLAREIARRMEKYMPKEYVPPTLIPEVPKKPTQPIPREPISEWMGPFPRRLTEEEYSLFWEHYAWELWRRGINPYSLYNQEIFAKEFRDLEYKSWEQVLERFRQIIDAAVKGKPIPKLPRREIPIFKEIPREPILWVLVGECEKSPELRAKRLEEVVEDVKDEVGVTVTVDDVKRIVEEEYRRGVDAHSWFKTLWERYPYYLWNLGFKFKELEEKARNKVFASLGSNPETLKELIDFVQSTHGYIVSEEEAKRWIREELEKPPEQANAMILLRRRLAEKLVK
jgi:hypothetical protein